MTLTWNVADDGSRIISETGCDDTTVVDDTTGQTFTCSATSRGGEATQSVTFRKDATAPQLTVPSNIAHEIGGDDAVVTYAATATDALDTSPAVRCTPPSGSRFAVGITLVTCTATDAAGNTSTAAFAVVLDKLARSPVVLVYHAVAKRKTRFTLLKLRNLPARASVTVTCTGRGCPAALRGKGVTLPGTSPSLKLTRLVKSRLKSGTRIVVTITAPGSRTTVKTIVIRKHKAPRVATTCVLPGASTAGAC